MEVAWLTPPCLKLAPQVSIIKTPLTSLNAWCFALFFEAIAEHETQ